MTSIDSYAFSYCSSLKSVFYQGFYTDSLSSTAFNDCNVLNTVCVSPDYNSTTFCGRDVTSEDDLCQSYLSQFTVCYKGAYDGEHFTQQKRFEVKQWENRSNDCGQFQCTDDNGFIVQVSCINDDDNPNLCMKDGCVNDWTTNLKGWSVEIGLDDGMLYRDIDAAKDELVSTISVLSKVGIDRIDSTGFEIEENETVRGIVIFVKDVNSARSISKAITAIDKEHCSYGILCKVSFVKVHHDGVPYSESSSSAPSSSSAGRSSGSANPGSDPETSVSSRSNSDNGSANPGSDPETSNSDNDSTNPGSDPKPVVSSASIVSIQEAILLSIVLMVLSL